MKKFSSVYAVMMVTSLCAGGLDDAFAHGKTEGYVRLGVQSHDQQDQKSDIAAGGKLKFITDAISGIRAGVGFYTSQGVTSKHNYGIPFYDNDNQSYSLLGEVYLEGNYQNTTLIIGRQILDTPFADSDDIGMIPNLFEAYTLVNSDLRDTTLMFAHITKMAGVDAENPSAFTKINGSDGMQVAGVLYEGITDIGLEGWFYHMANNVDILYLASSYEGTYKQGSYALGVQYALQDHKEGGKANIAGIMGEISHEASGFSFNAAYNKNSSDNKVVADNFFGGGPFFTSSEHLTLAEAGVNGEAYMAGISWDAGKAGVDGMILSLSVLQVEGDDGVDASETDVTVSYAPGEKLSFDLIYSDMEDTKTKEESFKNLRFFANYNF